MIWLLTRSKTLFCCGNVEEIDFVCLFHHNNINISFELSSTVRILCMLLTHQAGNVTLETNPGHKMPSDVTMGWHWCTKLGNLMSISFCMYASKRPRQWDPSQRKVYLLSFEGITVLCHFRNDLMPVISCLTSLTFWSLFHVISIPFCYTTCLDATFFTK